ncbi:unnamed protein product [Rangifer tarandus platyrhynchus]|uniref:Uncharacterized protein n=2 Tax=Rangifer tarandus platyrhynchus TaxID=3082113 RepID=A0ABN8ZB63_RANTA|nr:unnamed protein product [Rangifer tarandus platyrhynchus]
MDCSSPGSSVHGILPARILQWVAISFSRGSSLPRHQTRISCIADRFFTAEPINPLSVMCIKSLSHVQLFATPWSIAPQAPLSKGFSRQEHWSGLSFPPPGIFLTQGLNLLSLVSCIIRWVLYH